MSEKSMMYYINNERKINRSILNDKALQQDLSAIETKAYRDVIIFATGSSYNAATAAYLLMQDFLKIPVHVKDPSMSLHYEVFPGEDTLYLAISQGGHSASTLELIESFQRAGKNIYVLTSDLSSPIGRKSKNPIDMRMGIETMPYVTAGYTATILVLWLLSLEIATNQNKLTLKEKEKKIKDIEEVVDYAEEVIAHSQSWYQKNFKKLVDKKRFVFIGYGATYGVAREAETKFTETIHVPSHGYELEEYMHGPYLGLQKSDALFMIDGDGKLSERLKTLRLFLNKHMEKTILISLGNGSERQDLSFGIEIDEKLSPLLLTIPLHIFSYYISKHKKIDLNNSYYPDFDVITRSKI